MTTAQAHIEAIEQNLLCPGCEYNLRGLSGQIVTCPECGKVCDIAVLVSRKWTLPWYKAPGFTSLSFPTAASMMGLVLLGCVAAIGSGDPLVQLAFGGPWLIIWLGAWIAAWRVFGDYRGLAFGALVHLIVFVQTVGVLVVFACIVMVISVFVRMATGTPVGREGIVFVALGPVAALAIWGTRRLEKFICAACIRRHFQRRDAA